METRNLFQSSRTIFHPHSGMETKVALCAPCYKLLAQDARRMRAAPLVKQAVATLFSNPEPALKLAHAELGERWPAIGGTIRELTGE